MSKLIFTLSSHRLETNCACALWGWPADLGLFDSLQKLQENWRAESKKIIQLAGAKITEPTHASPVEWHGSPSLLAERASQLLVLEKNKVQRFRCDSSATKVEWLNLLTLLTMFPYSVIPEEPQQNPFSELFRTKLDPKLYGAGECVCVSPCCSIIFRYVHQKWPPMKSRVNIELCCNSRLVSFFGNLHRKCCNLRLGSVCKVPCEACSCFLRERVCYPCRSVNKSGMCVFIDSEGN